MVFSVSALWTLDKVLLQYIKDIPLWTTLLVRTAGVAGGENAVDRDAVHEPGAHVVCRWGFLCLFGFFLLLQTLLWILWAAVWSSGMVQLMRDWPVTVQWAAVLVAEQPGYGTRKTSWFQWSAQQWLVATVHLCNFTAKNDQFGI